jgi:hypothetical protein
MSRAEVDKRLGTKKTRAEESERRAHQEAKSTGEDANQGISAGESGWAVSGPTIGKGASALHAAAGAHGGRAQSALYGLDCCVNW